MQDKKTTLQELKDLTIEFVAERDWQQFHFGKNLAMNIAVEAAEIMEHFTWIHSDQSDQTFKNKQTEIEHEIADVFLALLCFCNKYNIDLTKIFKRKLEIHKKKYPVEKCRGKADKYTEYQS